MNQFVEQRKHTAFTRFYLNSALVGLYFANETDHFDMMRIRMAGFLLLNKGDTFSKLLEI